MSTCDPPLTSNAQQKNTDRFRSDNSIVTEEFSCDRRTDGRTSGLLLCCKDKYFHVVQFPRFDPTPVSGIEMLTKALVIKIIVFSLILRALDFLLLV